MQYIPLMQALNSNGNLNDNLSGLALRKWLDGLLHYIVQQVSSWHELGHNEIVFSILERFNVLEDVQAARLCAFAQNLQLLERFWRAS